jgi:hypothetical protein
MVSEFPSSVLFRTSVLIPVALVNMVISATTDFTRLTIYKWHSRKTTTIEQQVNNSNLTIKVRNVNSMVIAFLLS